MSTQITITNCSPGAAARRAAAIAAAVLAAVPGFTRAGVTNDAGYAGPGAEFVVSTTGATALGAFTRARNSDNSYNRGPFALGGTSLRIGQSNYTIEFGQFLGIADTASALANEPTLNNDRMVYKYHETGSIAGILELVDSNGLLLDGPGGSPLPARRPLDPTIVNPLFTNGNRFTAHSTGPLGGYSTGQNYLNNNFNTPTNPQTGQEFARIAYSDVRSEQGFAISGAAAVDRRPTEAGYGLGRGNIGNTNFQRLRNANVILGGVDPATTRLRNESLAVVPFNLIANPGTGMARITKTEGAWLNATGRLANGANFNVATRDSGSGTRNQGGNNLGIDPTWGSGERDRIALATYNATDPDGNAIVINPGDEADPRLSLTGTTAAADFMNESRVSPLMRFADKSSGSTGIRPTIQASRMGMGAILSSGDTGDNARVATTATPLRALAVDWGNGEGFVQATARNTTEGVYEMWSASQAITVAPYANPEANDTSAANGRPIAGDINDEAAMPGGGSNTGIHRKFLDNITRSVATLSAAPTNQTPVDAILTAGFIPPQIMGVTKQFDGSAQSTRTRSNVDPDGPGGPQKSEQEVWDIVTAPGGSLQSSLNWLDPSTHNGNVTGGTVRYNIYAPTNTLASSSSNADLSITINGRANLAGDMNNDGVRDLADVNDLAHAMASPTDFLLASGALTTNADSTVNDGSSLNSTAVSARAGGLLGAAPSAGVAGLIVLTDLNSDGNVVETSPGVFGIEAVSREDARYFLYGAAIDTSAFTGGSTTLNGQNIVLSAAQDKRENGVRLGQLRKNQAIDTFNAQLDALVDNGQAGDIAGFTQPQADALKFNKHDVDDDTFADIYDAVIVDRNTGKNYTNLTDALSTNDDLVAAELNDDNVINATDIGVMNAGLTGVGKTHWAGGVLEKTGPNDIVIARAAGSGSEVTVPVGGQTLKISSGTFSAGGTADPFTDTADPTRHVNIENNVAGTGVTSNLGFNITAGSKAIAALSGSGKTAVAAGATLTADSIHQNTLAVEGIVALRPSGVGASVVNNLVVTGTGKLDLADNKLIAASPAGTFVGGAYDGVAGLVDSARGNAGNAMWDGPSGITTSDTRAINNGDLVSIGVAKVSDVRTVADTETTTFAGETVLGSDTLAMVTWGGDANLDGKINIDDYGRIDGNVGQSGSVFGWSKGDFNYDGKINIDDYGIIDGNINRQGAAFPTGSGAGASAVAGASALEGVAAVPEPASLSLVAVGAMRLMRRRRRSH